MVDKVLLEEMSWKEVQKALEKTDIALVPIGSIEQHGYHLPLGTDTIIPYKIAMRVAREIGAVVAPPIRPGISQHHMPFPGSMTLAPSTLIAIIKDYCKSLVQHGFKVIVIINGHGSNPPCIDVAIEELKEELPSALVIPTSGFTIPKEVGVFGFDNLMVEGLHANRLETSQMLELAPELVKMDEAVAEFPETVGEMPPYAYAPLWLILRSQKQISQSGVVGDPTKATKELGRKVVDSLVKF
jgi:creatinine amidohydrolase